MRPIDYDKTEELLLDIKTAIYGSGIVIMDIEEETNVIMKLDCSIENDTLHHKIAYWGDNSIRNIQHKYKVNIEWINDNECKLQYYEDYFKTNLDYRKIYDNYDEMTIDLKRLMINNHFRVWSLNDIDFFTTARKIWFRDNQGVLLVVVNDDENCNCLDTRLTEPINEFMDKYGLEREYIEYNILGFHKKLETNDG